MSLKDEVPAIFKQLAATEVKHPDYYLDFTGDLLHSMAAALVVGFEETCLVLGAVAFSYLSSMPELCKRWQPCQDQELALAGLTGKYGADEVQVITDAFTHPDDRVMNKDMVCVAVIRDGCVVDYRAALVH